MTTYLDCNATTPLEPAVADIMMRFAVRDYGNAASPVHDYGVFARLAVEHARGQVAKVVAARRDEVIFTSGATEANNLALLGLAEHGCASGRRHLISSVIEHKAVLEPLEELQRRGFEITLIDAGADGRIDLAQLAQALRPDTLLVSSMQVNNETGIAQPLDDISRLLAGHEAFWHVDAAQGFGKEIEPLRDPRIDLISISAHKIYGPKGIGALIARRRASDPLPLRPLMFGGGQEQGLRPGTLPVHLIAGFGQAAQLAMRHHQQRAETCRAYRRELLQALEPLRPVIIGEQRHALPHALSLAVPGVAARDAIEALKDIIAISSSSACTADNPEPSHVLRAMRLPAEVIESALRLSWCHFSDTPDWERVVAILTTLRDKPARNPLT